MGETFSIIEKLTLAERTIFFLQRTFTALVLESTLVAAIFRALCPTSRLPVPARARTRQQDVAVLSCRGGRSNPCQPAPALLPSASPAAQTLGLSQGVSLRWVVHSRTGLLHSSSTMRIVGINTRESGMMLTTQGCGCRSHACPSPHRPTGSVQVSNYSLMGSD